MTDAEWTFMRSKSELMDGFVSWLETKNIEIKFKFKDIDSLLLEQEDVDYYRVEGYWRMYNVLMATKTRKL